MKTLYELFTANTKIVKRYRNNRCYACVWAEGTDDKKILHDMATGDANFFPFNEATGEFMYHLTNRPLRFKK